MAGHRKRTNPELIETEVHTALVSGGIISQIAPVQTAAKSEYVSVADYLSAEESSDVRHEYLGGLVYAMAGETRDHNQICQNITFGLRQQLKGGPCKLYMSDIRVNFDIRNDEYFYYPDIVVTCDKRDTHKRFVRHAKLIIEVLSESTERVDKREKFFAYTSIPSLDEYILVSQSSREITVFRRANDWKSEKISSAKATVTIQSVRFKLPLSAIYEGV